MPSVYPDFYPRFACKASACRHGCCRGWEIDVDDTSAARYLRQDGPLGDALRAMARPGDIILTVGAGDVYKIGENLVG